MDTNKVTNLIKPLKTKTREYSHLLSIIASALVAILCANFAFNLLNRLSAIEADRATLQSQIAALVLTMDDRERLLAIDRSLMQIPTVRNNLHDEVPALTKKLVDLQNKYYALGIRTSHILSVIEVESEFVANATSKTESGKPIAYGMMQLVPTTAKTLLSKRGMTWSPGLMYDPVLNIDLGTELLATIHENMIERGFETPNKFNLTHAIYYMGERNIMSYYLEHGTLHPTARDYVVRINQAQQRWAAKGL